MLHQLDIIDKHRLLLTVCHRPFGHSMTPSEEEEFIRKRDGKPDARRNSNYEIAYAKKPIVPLQVGDELLTIPLSEVNENVGFVIDVAINELGVAEGLPLPLLVGFLRMEVSIVMNTLAPYV
jgi:hypothetical protein